MANFSHEECRDPDAIYCFAERKGFHPSEVGEAEVSCPCICHDKHLPEEEIKRALSNDTGHPTGGTQ